jgi:hypothetical protein
MALIAFTECGRLEKCIEHVQSSTETFFALTERLSKSWLIEFAHSTGHDTVCVIKTKARRPFVLQPDQSGMEMDDKLECDPATRPRSFISGEKEGDYS